MPDPTTRYPVELTVQERDQHNNLTGGWYYASDSEIVEAARRMPGAEEMGPIELMVYAKHAPSGYYLVIPIADARRTEEEG